MPGKRKSDTAQLSASSDDSDGEPERIVEEGGIKIGDIYIPPPPPPVCSLDTGAPRLIITRIVNKNFKSYAGVQELGPFHKCFTSIIGPNGSGKSNVIDSMLFVFGYRGSKIRSKKISSLIHSSENHKTIQSCSVSVYFKLIIDKDEDYEEVPNSQFYVSRTGFKDNSSTYEIDGRRVPFKEVSIKLKKFGIDLDHNRFLILQGEVEQIAMMKPKGLTEHDSGMLEYLEDIIGTSRFKEPIEKLGVVVSELNDDRAAKVHKVNLVGTERQNMQGAYEEAIAFLRTENYITELRNTEYQKYIYDTEINKKQKEEKKNEIKTELETIAENIKEFIKKRKKLEDELSSKYEEKTKLEEKLQNLRDIFKQIDTKDNSARADMVQTNDRRKKSKNKLEEEKKKLLELEKVPEKNTADIKEIEKKLPKLAEEREKLETQKQQIIAEIAELTRPLQDERYRKESELIKLRENENKAKTELNLAETQLKVFVQNEKDATQTLEKIRTTYENSKKTLEEKQKLVEEHNRIFPAKEQELQQSNVELLELRNESKRIQEQVYTLTAKIEESRSSMQRAQFRNRVLNFLMKLKEQGVLPGILGRLGDLGAIDPKYDVAVSTACGPLDYIVVDTVDTANKCVNALKQQNIGRGNFMALEKMEYLRDYIQQRVKTPENIPRLYDLIQFKDQRLMTAFYFGVRETLVANDLEQATRIAYGKQRYRVVTLNGDMIELVGTMSGGGRTKISGRMGSKILVDTTANTTESPERIERYEQNVRELSERLRDMDNTKYDLERKVDQLSREVERMRSDLRKYVAECEAVKINLPNLERQIKQQEKVVQTTVSDKNRVKELEATIEAKRKQFEKENKIAGKLQEEVDALSEEISQQDGGRLKRVQNRLKEISQNIDKLKSESTRLTVGIKNAERNAVKCKNTIERIEESIQSDSEKILQLQQERVEIEADARSLNEKIQKMEEDLNEIKTDESDTEIKNEINELTKNEHKCKEDKINLEHELSTVEKTIKEFINNLSHWRKALSKLTLHTIPDNEVEIERLEHSVNSSKANTTVNNTNTNTSKVNVTGASIRTTDSIDNTSRTTQKKELRKLTDEELENCNVADIQYTITFQQDKLSKKPNLNIIEEYKKIQLEYCKRVREVEEVTNRRKLFRDALDKAKKTRENEFLTGYQIINLKLKEMYQMITLGGDAELELVDSLDPFNDGISFSVRPPKKSWKNICNLSGGEKTLSSLALVFALHYYKPSPLYVMDEIDAALDFKNVSIVGNYIKDRTKNAQFIIISLRSNMFELADRLVGIYKTYNCTKSVSVNPAGLHEILLNSLNQLQITIPTNQQLSQAIVQSQQSQPQPLTQTQQEQVENEPSQVIPTLQQNSVEINQENVLSNGIN